MHSKHLYGSSIEHIHTLPFILAQCRKVSYIGRKHNNSIVIGGDYGFVVSKQMGF
jgi:hypothetical protein